MEEKNQLTVSYLAYESSMARLERIIKRLWILCIICFVALIGTNVAWLIYESSFTTETVTETYTSTSDPGGTAVANREGSVIVYGNGEILEDNNEAP